MSNFLSTGEIGPKLTKLRDMFLSSIALGLAAYFCLNIERSVGSLVLGPVLKGVAVSTSLAWITTGYFGLWAVSQMALRVQGRSETLGSQLKLLSLIGGGLIVHGAYYGLLEAGFKASFALGVGGGLTAAFTFTQSLVSWYMEPVIPQSSDITGLVHEAKPKKHEDHGVGKKPAAKPAKPVSRAEPGSSMPVEGSEPSMAPIVGRPTTIAPRFDASRKDSDDSAGVTSPKTATAKPTSKKRPT